GGVVAAGPGWLAVVVAAPRTQSATGSTAGRDPARPGAAAAAAGPRRVAGHPGHLDGHGRGEWTAGLVPGPGRPAAAAGAGTGRTGLVGRAAGGPGGHAQPVAPGVRQRAAVATCNATPGHGCWPAAAVVSAGLRWFLRAGLPAL